MKYKFDEYTTNYRYTACVSLINPKGQKQIWTNSRIRRTTVCEECGLEIKPSRLYNVYRRGRKIICKDCINISAKK